MEPLVLDVLRDARLASVLAEASPDALIAILPDATVVFWNEAAEVIFGYPRAEAIGHSTFDLIIPVDRADETRQLLREASELGTSARESVRRRKDGTLIHVDVTAKRVHDAGAQRDLIVVSHKDGVTARKRADAKFRSVLESAPDAMVLADNRGRILMVNAQTERVFGFARDELLGQTVEILVPDGLKAKHPGMEFHGRHKDGREFPVEISLSPLETEDGVLTMNAIRDVSERKRAQAALEEKTRALQDAQAALARRERLAIMGQLAGGVSHELRNPLGVIKNAVYYLNMVLPEDPKVRKHLGIIEREIAAADRIVTGLLDFARVTPSNRAAMDLNATLREHLDRRTVPENVVIVVTLAESLPPVVADADQIELVLGNLTTNAVQAMPGGGTLTMETDAIEGDARVIVADTGAGISPEDLPKIFEPLFTTKAKGIGLGLTVARRLALANGATLTATSAAGQGSRFELRFSQPGVAG